MNSPRIHLSGRVRGAVLAALAVALLIGGGAWREISAAAMPHPAVAEQATAPAPMPSRAAAIGGRESYADIVKVVAPAVVTIRTQGRARCPRPACPTTISSAASSANRAVTIRALPRSPRQRGLGSGVIVSSDGYILTNHHVVDGADQVRVDLSDGRVLDAKVVGSDAPSDLAVVKVERHRAPRAVARQLR